MKPPAAEVVRSAEFSPCGCYRWRLRRSWSSAASPRLMGWIMLNPSTADGERDDPTIRRCMAFARRRGFGGVEIRNLFCWRATNPRDLKTADDPTGAEADRALLELWDVCPIVVAAWGADGALAQRSQQVLRLLLSAHRATWCLGRTRMGHPRHPLYLRSDSRLQRFN